ncbi:MAG: nitroreductase family protein [Proteobacteria bacterium]|nr:nitroreductase family protein [Pseudomonadota bacterium]MBU4296111.1 nitroreductase family protein [Pseudomonadota bacterium]MCG2746740.1 nitroreductase family protein [Desulfobulbaceae bacterium]
MSLFVIDESKCLQDGLCAASCPFALITVEAGKTFPVPVADAGDRCINCGHCMAICPVGALTLEKMEQGASCDSQLLPSFEQVTQLVRGRRSIRCYKKEPVDRETMARIIDLARYAPTARNSQLLGWMVIDSPGEIRHLGGLAVDWMRHMVAENDPRAASYGMETLIRAWESGNDPILRGAPGLVVVHAPADYLLAQVDSSIALNTFELAAFALGVGTCWAGFFTAAARIWTPLQDALQLPAGQAIGYAMMVGYPKLQYQRLPERKSARIIWR